MAEEIKIGFEGVIFPFPSSTILVGPMAAAKPLFAQKLIVSLLNRYDLRVIYFATSSPVRGILRNLKIFGLEEEKEDKIIFFDYNPSYSELKKVDENHYIGNFSEKGQLRDVLAHADEKKIVVIPSFTLLLVGVEEKMGLATILIERLFKKNVMSFIAVNSAMFKEVNKVLEDAADNVLEFVREEEKIHVRVIKFKGSASRREIPFDFPREMFQSTKREVAERTSRIIREKKEG